MNPCIFLNKNEHKYIQGFPGFKAAVETLNSVLQISQDILRPEF